MSVLNDTWRFLVQRRLWPVAILLIAAAAAVPMLLVQDPAPAPARRRWPSSADKRRGPGRPTRSWPRPPTATVPAAVACSARAKNPFKPQATPTPTPKPTEVAPTTGPARRRPPAGGAADGRGASPAPVGGTPGGPRPRAPKKKTYELNELTVRFGASERATASARDVKRLQALPSAGDPVLIYLGVLDDKKTAVFLLDSGVIAQGDGDCKPSRTTCETIHIQRGRDRVLRRHRAPRATTAGGRSTSSTSSRSARRRRRRQAGRRPRRPASRKAGRRSCRARIAGDGAAPLPLQREVGPAGEARQEGLQGRRRQGGARRPGPLLGFRPPRAPGASPAPA